ncbi:MAG TPA: DoxX family protein [Ktedonobacterales bacterium]|nr:DoxX family protein [Ktedonobacterales bacterium]
MNIVAIVVQVLLGLAFFAAGVPKLLGAKQSFEHSDHHQIAHWFWRLTGGIEIVGALGLLAGIGVHWVSVVAAAVLGATMLGALYTHLIRSKDPIPLALAPTILGLLALLVLIVRWTDFTHLFG